MKLDLHLHSHASDGRLSPEGVVQGAARGGLDVVALTDHDTAAGVPAAQAAGVEHGVVVVPGIEISTREPEGEFHVLGLFIAPAHPAILRHQDSSALRRTERMHRMVERLQALGVPVCFDDVIAAAGQAPRSLGRPHLARALLAGGHVRTFGEAFDRFLRDDGAAFVRTEFPTAAEAIGMIHQAGGLAIWAHPPLELFDAVLPRLAAAGLDGVECFRPTTPEEYAAHLFAAARAGGLLPSGGSDWHGPHHPPLGSFFLTGEQLPWAVDRLRTAPAPPPSP